MAQKVRPDALRRGVPVRGFEHRHPVMTGSEVGRKVPTFRTHWAAMKETQSTAGLYGMSVSQMDLINRYLTEYLGQHKLVVNRVRRLSSETGREVVVETVNPRWTKGNPEHPSTSVIDAGLKRFEMQVLRALRRSGHYNYSQVVIHHRPVESIVASREGWPEARDGLVDKLVPQSTQVTEAHLLEYYPKPASNEVPQPVQAEAQGQGDSKPVEKPKTAKASTIRLTSEAMVNVLTMAGVYPVAQAVSQMVAMKLEDALRHADVISEVKKQAEAVGQLETYGLMDIAAMERIQAMKRKPSLKGYHGILGYSIAVNGVIDGSRRTRKEVIKGGMLPSSTITAAADHGRSVAKTKVGTRGVSVTYHYK